MSFSISNKFEIHLLIQGMTGFFDCTGHLLLFGWMMFVFIFWHDHLYHGSLHFFLYWMVFNFTEAGHTRSFSFGLVGPYSSWQTGTANSLLF
jgi:hypothetical protein